MALWSNPASWFLSVAYDGKQAGQYSPVFIGEFQQQQNRNMLQWTEQSSLQSNSIFHNHCIEAVIIITYLQAHGLQVLECRTQSSVIISVYSRHLPADPKHHHALRVEAHLPQQTTSPRCQRSHPNLLLPLCHDFVEA